jgi:ADP-ribose pyrophosphatase YjhB (NUDIX family)
MQNTQSPDSAMSSQDIQPASEHDLPRWLEWAREIQALAQTGLAFSINEYEVDRNKRLLEIAADIIESYTEVPRDRWLEHFSEQQGYATPKVDVRGAVVRDGKILLVQERSDNRWAMPGGWADVGEVPSEMVAREVREESGLEVEVRKVVGVYDANRGGRPVNFYHAYKIIFLCEQTGGELSSSYETLDAKFFDFDQIPPLSGFRTDERMLADVLAHVQNPELPAVFD